MKYMIGEYILFNRETLSQIPLSVISTLFPCVDIIKSLYYFLPDIIYPLSGNGAVVFFGEINPIHGCAGFLVHLSTQDILHIKSLLKSIYYYFYICICISIFAGRDKHILICVFSFVAIQFM